MAHSLAGNSAQGASAAHVSALTESQHVETLRGLACVLLVAFHVVGSEPNSGLHAADGSLYRQFGHLFHHARMPLFTFLSGFVYAYRPLRSGELPTFARKKVLRLLVPLICVSTLYYVVATATPGASGQLPLHEAWRMYIFPYVHFWFLQAIIIIFAGVMMLERFRLLGTPARYGGVLAVLIAIHLAVDLNDDEFAPFSSAQAAYLAPFFVLGLGANRFRNILRRPALTRGAIAVFLVSMTIYTMTLWLHQPLAPRGSVLGLLIGVTSALTLLRAFPSWKPLALLGAYSFAVYLFHPFFVGGSRTALKVAGLSSATELVFVTGLAAGLIGPVILERVLGRVPVVSRMLFGQSASQGREKKHLQRPLLTLPANIEVQTGAATMTLPTEQHARGSPVARP
jgi:peptidoglycan/LPS O-acetylase OafA/YrhL